MSEPQPPAEPSVGGDQPPKEQSDDADTADTDSDRRRPRESLGEERETKRVRINVLDGEESDDWVETEEEWVRIHRRPRRDLFSPHDSQGGPKLSDISKRRESIVCSTDGGERRIVVDLSSTGGVRLAEPNCDGLFVEQMEVTHVQKDGRGTNKESALAEDVLSRHS